MRSLLSDADLNWAGFGTLEKAAYRQLRRGLVSVRERSLPNSRAEAMFAEWDSGCDPEDEFIVESDGRVLNSWHEQALDLMRDVELPWRERNIQGFGTVLRVLAEHLALGSLRLGVTYRPEAESAGPARPFYVVGPPGHEERLKWARRRMENYLSGVTEDPYDGLTILAGFAHPSRFSQQSYLDGDLTESRPIVIARENQDRFAGVLGVIALRLTALYAFLAEELAVNA